MFECVAAVEADAGDAGDCELDGEDFALVGGGVVARGVADGCDFAVGEGLRVEVGGLFGVFVVPEADGVLVHGGALAMQSSRARIQHGTARWVPGRMRKLDRIADLAR